ncbi:P110/LppT family adhesin N-terminal domain [Mesomycoplasma ovipneumoniae]|uniref:P110/LppT family adhesin N-terminal domain n=1 Tax=Mesomycoplasma ovipneumoniae TaxID=29562 RepID=UPI0028ABA78E|nr:P110/LppT family adhesin N-terminal domain [Mesomycoplasma ovipneumoniae]MDW2933456.1 P110/LppT family adhesin N-terminal domain [Mesomycoplasma ovipneumoniae]WNM15488.1 P110/LppT family adhesin N-terminal domain [Mesomycoplasma ovipneumoniae]
MKKLKLNHIIFAIIGVSTVVSISASVPYLISLQSKNYNSKLSEFDDKLANATNLNVNSEFNTSEFDNLVANLKLKSKFAKKLSASDALNLHFDKAYNFDLNNAIDFSEISQKYPDLNFRLVVPRSQSEVKIESNKIKNLAVNISNSSKSINYTASFDLDFSDQDKTLNFSAQNLSASISLLNQDFLEGKTATEIAILFYNEFKENFEKTKNSSSALFATFSKFGGISFNINSEPVFVFPSNFEIKPELQEEKLNFTNIDDVNNKIDLALSLFDKKTQKSSKLTLNFVDVPKKTDQKKSFEFLKIFKKNYKFNSTISKHLAENKLSVSEYFAQNPQSLNLEQFNSWFTSNSTENENKTFLEEIKDLIPNFSPKSVAFSVKENKNNPKNSNIVNVGLNIEGNFTEETLLPLGLKLGEDNTYTFNFELEFDANEEIYGAYFKNAIETFDKQGSENIDNLTFEIKKDLPITVFASTIDDKIQPFLNKPYDIKNITTQLTPFFEALNFFAAKSNKINQTQIAPTVDQTANQDTEQSNGQSTDQTADGSGTPATVATNAGALPTLFQDTTSDSPSSPSTDPTPSPSEGSAPTSPTPAPSPTIPSSQQSLLGDYLRKLLEGLEKSDLPEGTSIYFSRDHQDETYEINLKIKTPNGVERNLTIELDNVNEENKLYKSFSDTVKTHLFLDWKTNIETEEQSLEDGQKQQVVKSISAVNNPNFRFKANPAPSEKFKEKVHVDEQEQGIYLAEGGISLENDQNIDNDLKLENGTSLLYAFKPSKLPQTDALQYFLLKTGEEENDLNLVIEKELFVPGVFKIGADFVAKPKTRPSVSPSPSFNPKKEGFKTTYNGEYDIQLKLSNGEPSLSLGNTKPKNPLSFLQDFLNNSESTIILRVDIEKKDSKSVMNMKFYSTESDDAKKPIFTWSLDIPKDAKLNFKKGFTFGTTKAENQKSLNEKERSETGITFKGFVLFDTPQTEEEYNKLFEKFRSEYL